MIRLGIEEDKWLIYEGDAGYFGRAIWPAPVITPAKIVFESEGPLIAERRGEDRTTACRFREDSYDPVSRIRRGRFYTAQDIGQQPTQWRVHPHPALPFEAHYAPDRLGLVKRLHTFRNMLFFREFIKDRKEQPLVLLGFDDCFTVWVVTDVEAISSGEDLVTLKARGTFGILPVYDDQKIPERYRAKVTETLDTFADSVHRSAPISVIDRARDAASQILLAHFNLSGEDAKDLGNLAKRAEKDRLVVASASHIIARLHARNKPSERERRKMRAIREQDAELATQCLGVILCELGWAEWK
ncbi:hypothetical protein [Hyphococcus sp.]|uniref:hypothetical protein n=1 Tax=Hyphococcus sp. TaxID=2038636 RepID=UPI003D0AC540